MFPMFRWRAYRMPVIQNSMTHTANISQHCRSSDDIYGQEKLQTIHFGTRIYSSIAFHTTDPPILFEHYKFCWCIEKQTNWRHRTFDFECNPTMFEFGVCFCLLLWRIRDISSLHLIVVITRSNDKFEMYSLDIISMQHKINICVCAPVCFFSSSHFIDIRSQPSIPRLKFIIVDK